MMQRVAVNCAVVGGEPPPREGRIGASAQGGRIGASARAVIVVPHGELQRLTHRMRPHQGIGQGSPLRMAAAGADRLGGSAVPARDTPGTASHARACSAGDDERLAAPAESAGSRRTCPVRRVSGSALSRRANCHIAIGDPKTPTTHHYALGALSSHGLPNPGPPGSAFGPCSTGSSPDNNYQLGPAQILIQTTIARLLQ